MNEPRTQQREIPMDGDRLTWDCRDADTHTDRTCGICEGPRDECAPDDIRCEYGNPRTPRSEQMARARALVTPGVTADPIGECALDWGSHRNLHTLMPGCVNWTCDPTVDPSESVEGGATVQIGLCNKVSHVGYHPQIGECFSWQAFNGGGEAEIQPMGECGRHWARHAVPHTRTCSCDNWTPGVATDLSEPITKTTQATHASELTSLEHRSDFTEAEKSQLRIALAVSLDGKCVRRKTGCTVVIDGRVVTTGYNGTEAGEVNCTDGGCERCADDTVESGTQYERCVCVHCEENAIAFAAYWGISLRGGIMYISSEGLPQCKRCARLVRAAGIKEVILL